MAGKIYPNGTQLMSVEAGFRVNEERGYRLITSGVTGAVMIESEKTGMWWSISWKELLDLAIAAGIDCDVRVMTLDEAIKTADATTNAAFETAARGECQWVCPDCCTVFPEGIPNECPHGHQNCTAWMDREKAAAAPQQEGA